MKFHLGVTCAVFAAAVVLLSTPAHAAKPTVTTFSVSFSVTDGCTGEVVDFTGTETDSFSVTINSGSAHISEHLRLDATGVGETTGASYSIHANENTGENVDIDPTTNTGEENIVIHENINSQGGAPNEDVLEKEHITVNANGTVTVDSATFSDECHG